MPKFAAINKKSSSSTNPDRISAKNGQRTKSTIMRLKMYKSGKAIRNKDGKVVGGSLMMSDKSGGQSAPKVARIAPDRRYFGNTRTLAQSELDRFREEMTLKAADPYSVVLRRKKIPMALLQDSKTIVSTNLLEMETFDSVFGEKKTRKRAKLSETVTSGYEELLQDAKRRSESYSSEAHLDSNIQAEDESSDARKDDIFSKGQSKRIWGELYKVLDCSDVILQVLDARDIPGTRSRHIEKFLKKNSPHKHMVLVVNKCDLIPSWATRKWVQLLSEEYPTVAFHGSITNAFGKGALINLLRQFGKLHSDKRQISVGVIGYPNTGKSSVINALMGTKCCKAAPIPGETKIWQYIALTKRIFLIDCPGVVYDIGDDEADTVLKGVVRAEKLKCPSDFIETILDRVSKVYIKRQYSVDDWSDTIDFLGKVAAQNGKLLKGGEPDINSVSVSIINDWQRGKLPHFVAPPNSSHDDEREVGDDLQDVSADGQETADLND